MSRFYKSQMTMEQPIASNKPQLFESLAQRMSAFANVAQDTLDRDMAKRAKEQGAMDMQGKTELVLRDGNTIADDAWNQGAMTSYASALKLDSTENLARISAETPNDPGAYTQKAKAYASGILDTAPPQIRPALQDEFAATILNTGLKKKADLVSIQREQQAATTGTAIDLYRVEGENAAQVGDIQGATEAQLKAIELTNSLESSGLLSPASAEKQRRDTTRDIEDQVIYGAFSREMANGRALKYIKNFKKLKELGDRDPDYRGDMVKEMISMMDKSHTASDAALKRERELRKERHFQGERDISELDLTGELTLETLQDMVKADKISPKIAEKYKASAATEGLEFSSGTELNLVKQDLINYTETDINTNPLLSRKDKTELILEQRELIEDKENWRRTQSGGEGARRINQAFGIIKGVDTRITEDKAKRAGDVLTRYYNEINALPPEQREMKAIEVSDRLVKEVKGEIATEDLTKARDRLAKNPYQTIEQVKEAGLGTEEEKVQILQLERKLRKIERLERDIGQ